MARKEQYTLQDEALFSDFEGLTDYAHLQEWNEQQDYKFTAIVYPDCKTYWNGRTAEDILTIVRNWGYLEWYYILHDKDVHPDGTPKKPHYHILVKLTSPGRLDTFARQLGIPTNYVQRVKSFKGMAKYLLHDENIDKAKYLAEEVVCKDTQEYLKYFSSTSEQEEAGKILDYIVESGCQSYIQLLSWCVAHDLYATCRRNASMFSNCIRECQKVYTKQY